MDKIQWSKVATWTSGVSALIGMIASFVEKKIAEQDRTQLINDIADAVIERQKSA